MNRVNLTGRLTRDPELRTSAATGESICTFTLAVDRMRKKDGSKETDFLDCVCFGKQGENLAFFKRKGAMLGVDGRIQKDKYTTKDEETRYRTKIIAERVEPLER